jgi:1-acyl-sn-glycerol-3-phosphate acyltransferase
MGNLRRLERLARSSLFSIPFVATNILTRYEIEGLENLEWALALRAQRQCGLISISNHLSLFDDPLVIAELLRIRRFNVETKIWWSTPCESNFNPRGGGLTPALVRTFSDVSNMVFFARPSKKGAAEHHPEESVRTILGRGDDVFLQALAERAEAEDLEIEELLARYLTPPAASDDHSKLWALNQPGMLETCARVALGDWLHFFPEGGRSRSIHLRSPKRGVGKVIAHNPNALVLPICFYGTQDVLPLGTLVPRPFKRIVVSIGEPVIARVLVGERPGELSRELFLRVAERAWGHVKALRPSTLVRYLGPASAIELLKAEAPAATEPKGEHVNPPATPTSKQRPRRSRLPNLWHVERHHE